AVMAVLPQTCASCGKTSCDRHARVWDVPFHPHSSCGCAVLRALFIRLSESRSLRQVAEHSSLGQKFSSRFVAGLQVEDALRVAQSLNQAGLVVSVDNLGENVTNAEEARA